MHKELMTVKEAAKYLRLSESKVRQLVFIKEIGHLKFGRSVRFNRFDLDKWIDLNKQEATNNQQKYLH